MSKNIAKSSFILVSAGIVCKILGGLFRLPLTNILGVKGIGYFQMVMSLYVFTLVLCSGGITITLSKLVAEPNNNKEDRINSLYKISLITSLILGSVVGILFYLFANHIAVLQGGNFGDSYKLMIPLLVFGGIIACFRGVLQGLETMYPTAISQVIEQGIRFIFGLLFAGLFVKKSVELGVFGAFVGIVAGELLSLIYLFIEVKKRKIKFKGRDYSGFYRNLLPILIGGSILPLVNAIDSLMIVNRLTVAGFNQSQAVLLFGIQTGIVGTVLNIPAMLSSSLAVAILPSVASLKEDSEKQKQRICTAFKYLWILLLPMVLGIMAIAEPLYTLIYPSIDYLSLQYAVNLTLLGGISSILLAIMQFFVTILQAKENLIYLMFLQIIGGLMKIFIVYKFCAVAEINVYGLIFGNIFLSSVVIIGALIKLKDVIQIPFLDIILPLFSSVIMYVVVKYFVASVNLSTALTLLLGICIGVFIYSLFNIFTIKETFKMLRTKKEINLIK